MPIYQMYCIMQYNILTATPSFITLGFILAIYCVQYLQAMPFLRNKIPYCLLKPYQKHVPFQGEVKIHNYTLSVDLLPLYLYTTQMPQCSRVYPVLTLNVYLCALEIKSKCFFTFFLYRLSHLSKLFQCY